MFLSFGIFGFDERIITLIKVEPGCPSLLCLRLSTHTVSIHGDGELSPHASDPGSGPIVWQHPLISSHLVWVSNIFTFHEQSLSKWHQWLYCRERPLKAPQPLLPPIIERDEKEAEERKKREKESHCGVSNWFVKVPFPKGAPVSV